MRGAEPRRTRGEGAQFGVYWLQILSSLQGRGKKKTKKNTKSCHTPPSREASAQNPNIQNNLKGENYTGIFTSLINRLILIQAPLQTCACGWGMGWPWCSWGRGVGPHPDGSHPWCSPAWGRGLTTAVPTRHRGAHGCRTRQGSASPVPSDCSLTQLQPPWLGRAPQARYNEGQKCCHCPGAAPCLQHLAATSLLLQDGTPQVLQDTSAGTQKHVPNMGTLGFPRPGSYPSHWLQLTAAQGWKLLWGSPVGGRRTSAGLPRWEGRAMCTGGTSHPTANPGTASRGVPAAARHCLEVRR